MLVLRLKHWLRPFAWSSSLLIASPAWSDSAVNSQTKAAVFRSPEPAAIEQQVQEPQAQFSTLLNATPPVVTQSERTVDSPNISSFNLSKNAFYLGASSKSAWASAQYSRRAADLTIKAVAQFNPISSSENNGVWIAARSQLPSLTTIPVAIAPGFIDDPASLSRSSTLSAPTKPLTVAAEPGTPAAPPIPLGCDPELGCIDIQTPAPFPTAPPPVLYLTPRVDFFQSSNILLGIDPVNDGLIRPALSLLTIPSLGRDTFIVASVEVATNLYFKTEQFNYNEFRARAGIFQRLSPTMSAEVGWTNQQLFIANDKIRGFPAGTRFLDDQAARLELSRRDQFNQRLFLSSFYQLRAGFAKPADRSRILNVLVLSLNYDLTPTTQFGLDYQFAAANFTVVPRTDIYHQLLGRITFNAFRNTQVSVYGGRSLGNSTEPGIDFNSFIFGATMTVNLVLF